MKKVLVFILILTFLLVGCKSDNIGSSSNINSENSQTANNNVSSLLSSSEPEYVDTDGGYCYNVWNHYETDTVEKFINWTKKGVNTNDDDCTENFLNWRKKQTSITVPKLINKNYTLQSISIEHFESLDSIIFRYTLKDADSKKLLSDSFWIYGYPLDETQKSKSLYELEKEFGFNVLNIKKTDKCDWGEYHYIYSNEGGSPTVNFLSQSILYSISIPYESTDPWQDEYFDYFDFEAVSLK